MLKSGSELLMIPGPTTLPGAVVQALCRPATDIYHGPLHDVSVDCLEGLGELFGTQERTYIFTANGHGAWEAALSNTLSAGDHVLALESGLFATNWAETARDLGLESEVLPGSWRRAVDPGDVERRLKKDGGGRIKAVLTTQIDTATGVLNDICAIRKAMDCAGHDALLMVDCIASLGAAAFRFDDWGVDVAVAASQKALMTPPGLSFHAVSPKARRAHARAGLRSNYWNWSLRDRTDHYYWHSGTPPVSLLFGFQAALGLIREEGLSNVIARHNRLALAARASVEHWSSSGGVELNVRNDGEQAGSVTVMRVPEGMARPLVEYCKQNFGVLFGEGIGALDGKAIRIGHMGHVGAPQLIGALGCLEIAMVALGVPHAPGGLESALRDIASTEVKQPPSPVKAHEMSI